MNVNLDKREVAAGLDAEARQVHQSVLTAFARTGAPPAVGELDDKAVAELAERDLIVLGSAGEIRVAYPFSATPTAHRVTIEGGPTAYSMCAVDALGISAMLGRPVTITSEEPGAGRTITVKVDGERAEWRPETAVVFAGKIDDACCATSADRTCGFINFFGDEVTARAWADRNTTVAGLILSQGDALACGIAEFGDLLAGA